VSPTEVARAVAAAAERLEGKVVRTPTVPSPWWSATCGREVRLKLENVQATGSFKLRGATHALLRLPAAARARGVLAASSGNHGLGLACAAQALGVAATIYVGTIAVELLAQWPEVETVYVAMGGGGLLAGMAAYAKSVRPDVEFVACSPAESPAMAACVRAGAIVDVPCHDTFSDSTAGGVEPGAITFPLCRDLVDRWIEVDERAIAIAVADALAHSHLLVEGAAGVAFAACRQDADARGRRSAVLVCGANVPYERLRAMLAVAGR